MVERLERSSAALRERERRVDERQREAADRHRRSRRDALAAEHALDGEDARAALMADGDEHLVVASASVRGPDIPAVAVRVDGLHAGALQRHLGVRRSMAEQGLEAVAEVAADLRPRRVVVVAAPVRLSPLDERAPLGARHDPARRPPHVEVGGGEVHAQVRGLAGVVDRAGSGCAVRLEDVDADACLPAEAARVLEQPLEREEALRAEAHDRDPQGV